MTHLSILKKKEDEYRRQLIKLKSHETFLENEIIVVNKSILEINKDYDYSLNHLDEEIICPTCNAMYENSMVSRFGLLEDIDTCRNLLSDYLEEKKAIGKNISKAEEQLNFQRARVQKITNLIDEKKGKVRLKDLIQNESSKQVKKVFEKSETEYSDKITKLEIEENTTKENRTKLNNKERKQMIISNFNDLLNTFLIKLNVHTVSSNNLNDIPLSVKAQGSDTPRALLAYYYAIIYISRKFTSLPIFPLIIDSPNQQDQDNKNRKNIIQFICDNTPNEYQLILGTVELHGVEYQGHTISPSTNLKVLCTEEYENAYGIIAPLLDKLQAQLIKNDQTNIG